MRDTRVLGVEARGVNGRHTVIGTHGQRGTQAERQMGRRVKRRGAHDERGEKYKGKGLVRHTGKGVKKHAGGGAGRQRGTLE